MKLSSWAKEQGIKYITAYRWFRKGILPVHAIQLKTGTVLVYPKKEKEGKAVIYARVSSADQKEDLNRQIARLVEYANKNGISVDETITEIGSGLNGHRKKLYKILSNDKFSTIIVEHKDRLVRFGFEYISASLKASSRKIIVKEQRRNER